MADLIDRQALLRDIEKYHLSDGKFQHWVEAQPSVETEPVRHGRWMYKAGLGWGETWVCSECGERTTSTAMGKPRYKYCPMCGARMGGEQND